MRLALLAPLLVLGCTEDPPSGPLVDSHVAFYELPAAIPPQLDVLVVVDDTTGMAAHPSALAGLGGGAELALLAEDGAAPDVRIAVTTTASSGALRQPASGSDPYLSVGYDAYYERSQSFSGSLADALDQLAGVGATSTASVQPLEAAKQALDTHPEFLRSTAGLGILTITASDDASPGAPTAYATALEARKTDPSRIMLVGIYPDGAARLDAFHAEFPNRAEVVDLATADVSTAFVPLENVVRTVLGVSCFREPADVDAVTPGVQYECDMNAYYADGSTEPLRQCQPSSTERCFELVEDPQNCVELGTARFEARGFPTRYAPAIRGQCVVIGEG